MHGSNQKTKTKITQTKPTKTKKPKKYYIVQMKSAKGEPMDGNMPAVR